MLRAVRTFSLAVAAVAAALGAASPAHATTVSWAEAQAQAVAAAQQPQSRIFNGSVADVRQSPWHVLVYSIDGYGKNAWLTTCGGSIVNPTTVITAAHCVADVKNAGRIGQSPDGAGGLGIVAGVSNFHYVTEAGLADFFSASNPPGAKLAATDTEQDRTITNANVHPGWPDDDAGIDQFPSGDVAVIHFATPLTYTAAIGEIALPPSVAPVDGEPIPFNPSVRTVGFGLQNNTSDPNGLLYAQPLNVVDRDICGDGVDAAVNICAQTPYGTTCSGDSGSGLVTNDTPPVLVGLVSAGPDPCRNGDPTYFTSLVVPENRQFIAGLAGPPRAPRQFSAISLGFPYTMAVGDSISCSGGSFSPVSSIKWKITNDLGSLVAQGVGQSFSYALTSADVGRRLSCRAYAASPGGVALSERTDGGSPLVSAGRSGSSFTPVGGGATATPVAVPIVTAPNLPIAPRAAFAVASTPKAKRGKLVTVKVIVSKLPAGSDTAIISVPRIPTVKGSKASVASVTNYPKGDATTTTFTVRIRVPKRAQTGVRKLPLTVFVYKLGTLVSSLSQTIQVKITK